MKALKVKDMKWKGNTVTICYARNGHRLYEGLITNIPEHLLNYYCGFKIYNKYRANTYIEVTEDEKWWL